MDEPVTSVSENEDQEKLARIEMLASMAKGVVQVLVKTVRATKMYLPNNPVYQKFYEELNTKLNAYFEEEDLLSLVVRKFDLVFLDQEVYHNPDKDDNIALMFFKDGVREFCFHRGITEEETRSFIDILKFDMADRELDDDLVTLMWEKDFENVSYTVADEETEEEAAEEEAFLSFETEDEAVKQLDMLKERVAAVASPAGQPAPDVGAGPGGGVMSAGVASAAGFEAAADDYESIRGIYPTPDDLALLTELTDIFYEILITEKDEGVFVLVSDSLSSALDIFIGRGDLALATILLMKIQELVQAMEDPGRRDRLDAIIDRASSEASVSRVGEFIEEGAEDFIESSGSYLRQLDKRAIDPLVKLLDILSSRKARRMITDIIVELCAGDGMPLTRHLKHDIWYVARNIAMVLGGVGDPKAAGALGAAMSHENPKVRREVIGALAIIKGADAERYIEEALSDPEKSNRLLAGRSLVELAPEKAYRALTETISRKGYGSREFDEMRETYSLIGRVGGEKAVPFLAKRFKHKGFFDRRKKDLLRACVAYGLAATGTDEAYELLSSESGSKSDELRTACRQGIKTMDKQRGAQ